MAGEFTTAIVKRQLGRFVTGRPAIDRHQISPRTIRFPKRKYQCESRIAQTIVEVVKVSLFSAFQSAINSSAPLKVRITGGRTSEEGQVEVFLPQLDSFAVICGEHWSLREAAVVCRQLGLNYAQQATQSDFFGWTGQVVGLSGVFCTGEESRLDGCLALVGELAHCSHKHSVAGVVCTSELPDLQLDLEVLQASLYLHDLGLYYLQCAMEENCAAPTAYEWRKEHDWYHKTRRLLRFSTKVHNVGDTDFRPFRNKQDWQWHQCHMHHHSMEVNQLTYRLNCP